MFDEPEETPQDRPFDPLERAKASCDEFRMHAELAAIFEGVRKFEARILPTLSPEIARETQRTVARLEKSRLPDTPVIAPEIAPLAAQLLDLPDANEISTN